MKKQYFVNDSYFEAEPDEPKSLLTLDMIEELAKNERKLYLIKILRMVAGLGLKDAKDGVEWNCYENQKLSPEKAKAYFAYWITKPITNEGNDKILKGIRAALKSWEPMGFNSPFEACRTVLNNLE